MPDELQTGHKLYVFMVTGANRKSFGGVGKELRLTVVFNEKKN